jgi:hypothetical protein
MAKGIYDFADSARCGFAKRPGIDDGPGGEPMMNCRALLVEDREPITT